MLKDRSFSFGPFVLFADRATLCCDEKPVRIGSRAIEILTALVERAGAVVSGEDLITRTWPDTHVEENTLRVHLVSLRKILAAGGDGSQYIINVPGRGYRFAQPVKAENGCFVTPRSFLPPQPTHLFGRSHDIARILAEMQVSRLVNIVGSGACGKSSLALAVAQSAKERFHDGVIFVDLAPVPAALGVTDAMAHAMAITSSSDTEHELISQLRNMEALVILDNCEHVVERVAMLSKMLLRRAPAVRILATSREAFMLEEETQYQLAALEYPEEPNSLYKADDALLYPSIQLFMHSTTAAGTGYTLTDQDAPVIAAICKHLEGKPLYIELAASAVACCTPTELNEELSHSLSALTRGQRTAPLRQRSLRCSLDWGFRVLSPEEQNFLVCLALFDQPFDRASAMMLADFSKEDAGFALELLGALVAKFWLTPTRGQSRTMYSLSSLTRIYLREKLYGLENAEDIRHRYAELASPSLKEAEWERPPERSLRLFEDTGNGLVWHSSHQGDIAMSEPGISINKTLTKTTRFNPRSLMKSRASCLI